MDIKQLAAKEYMPVMINDDGGIAYVPKDEVFQQIEFGGTVTVVRHLPPKGTLVPWT